MIQRLVTASSVCGLMYLIQRLITDWTVWAFDVVDTKTFYGLDSLGI